MSDITSYQRDKDHIMKDVSSRVKKFGCMRAQGEQDPLAHVKKYARPHGAQGLGIELRSHRSSAGGAAHSAKARVGLTFASRERLWPWGLVPFGGRQQSP
jgi:hypothetical protein